MKLRNTISILRGFRGAFYSQGELEKKGWALQPSEQRRFEHQLDLNMSRAFATGCGLILFAAIFQTSDPNANPLWHLSASIMYAIGVILAVISIIYIIMKKN